MSLYHYTDVNGLLGILNNNSLWATNIHFLNDIKELYAGVDDLTSFCEKEKKRTEGKNIAKEILVPLCRMYDQTIETIHSRLNNNLDSYIISFTDKKDNLRQWMSYCPPNGGYCIEFDKEMIINKEINLLKNHIISNLRSVIYETLNFESYLSIEQVIIDIKENMKEDNGLERYLMNRDMKILLDCCTTKKSDFSDESEERIIIQARTSNENIKYRTKSGIIIPYYEYTFNPDCIKSVLIGPNTNIKLARKGLENFLLNKNIKCSVEESACSLRLY